MRQTNGHVNQDRSKCKRHIKCPVLWYINFPMISQIVISPVAKGAIIRGPGCSYRKNELVNNFDRFDKPKYTNGELR